jgi:hypothetical protein
MKRKHKTLVKAFGKKKIGKRLLSKFVRQNKSTKSIARYFKVSERTVYRRIKQYNLKGIRTKGKKPFTRIRKPFKLKFKPWVLTKEYVDKLNRTYHFQNIQYPPTKYVHTTTLVCSDTKRNPKGTFTTCSVYYVGLESKVYFLYAIRYRYSDKSTSFESIFNYFSNNARDMVSLSLEKTDIELVDIAAYHFTNITGKPVPQIGYTNMEKGVFG